MGLKESGLRGSLRNVSVGIDAIPDVGLDHFYYAPSLTSVDPWTDEKGSIDLSANGSPQLVPDSINNEQAVEYDSDDNHQGSSTGSFGADGEWTAAGIIERSSSDSGFSVLFEVGSGSNGYAILADENNSGYTVVHRGADQVTGGSLDTDPHVYVATHDGSAIYLDIDGATAIDGATIDSPSDPTDHITIGERANGGEEFVGSVGAGGHEAAFADSTRRDELTDLLAEPFGISTST